MVRRQLPLKNSLLLTVPKKRGHATSHRATGGINKVSQKGKRSVLGINTTTDSALPSSLTEKSRLESTDYSEQSLPYY